MIVQHPATPPPQFGIENSLSGHESSAAQNTNEVNTKAHQESVREWRERLKQEFEVYDSEQRNKQRTLRSAKNVEFAKKEGFSAILDRLVHANRSQTLEV